MVVIMHIYRNRTSAHVVHQSHHSHLVDMQPNQTLPDTNSVVTKFHPIQGRQQLPPCFGIGMCELE